MPHTCGRNVDKLTVAFGIAQQLHGLFAAAKNQAAVPPESHLVYTGVRVSFLGFPMRGLESESVQLIHSGNTAKLKLKCRVLCKFIYCGWQGVSLDTLGPGLSDLKGLGTIQLRGGFGNKEALHVLITILKYIEHGSYVRKISWFI